MDRPAAVPDHRRIPGAYLIVSRPDKGMLHLRRPLELRREPHGYRGEDREIAGAIPWLEAQILPEHVPHVVCGAFLAEDRPLDIRSDTRYVASHVEVLGNDAVVPLHVIQRILPQVLGIQGDAVVVDGLEVGTVRHDPADRDLGDRVLRIAGRAGGRQLHHVDIIHTKRMFGRVYGIFPKHYKDNSQELKYSLGILHPR